MNVADKSCLDSACRKVAAAAAKGGWQLALAESCTGGLAAEGLTAMAGASQWFSFGIVCYANSAKTNILGISAAALQKYGAVSEQTAAAMCEGAMALFAKNNRTAKANNANGGNVKTDNADGDNVKKMTIAITGIAGPGGDDNTKKPVGTVCFGWQTKDDGKSEKAKSKSDKSEKTITETRHFPGNRESVRHQSAAYALQKAAAIMVISRI
ncbi:MAG: CinA family protein [Gammaproteobacteria bacterium]